VVDFEREKISLTKIQKIFSLLFEYYPHPAFPQGGRSLKEIIAPSGGK